MTRRIKGAKSRNVAPNHHRPKIDWREVGYFRRHGRIETWPEDIEMPTHYLKPRPTPCQRCKKLLLPDGGQAVILKAVANTEGMAKPTAYFRCKACFHQFKLPVI